MHLGQIASTIDIPIETLRQLNPQYKLDIIPATTKPYTDKIVSREMKELGLSLYIDAVKGKKHISRNVFIATDDAPAGR